MGKDEMEREGRETKERKRKEEGRREGTEKEEKYFSIFRMVISIYKGKFQFTKLPVSDIFNLQNI